MNAVENYGLTPVDGISGEAGNFRAAIIEAFASNVKLICSTVTICHVLSQNDKPIAGNMLQNDRWIARTMAALSNFGRVLTATLPKN
jgi:hypothetical protein